MKDKKGFTLMELIAVVIIIGLIMMITVPSILKYVRKTESKVVQSHLSTMENAAKARTVDLIANNDLFNCGKTVNEEGKYSCPLPKGGSVQKVSVRDLIDSGYTKDLKNPTSSKKQQEYCDAATSYVAIENKGGKDSYSDFEYRACLKCGGKEFGKCREENLEDLKNVCDINSGDCAAPTCKVLMENRDWTNKDVTTIVECQVEEKNGKKNYCVQDQYVKTFKLDKENRKTDYIAIQSAAQLKMMRAAEKLGMIDDYSKYYTPCNVSVLIDKIKPKVVTSLEKPEGSSSSLIWQNTQGGDKFSIKEVLDPSYQRQAQAGDIFFKNSQTILGSGVSGFGMGTELNGALNGKREYMPNQDGISSIYAYAEDFAKNRGFTAHEMFKDVTPPDIKDIYYGYQVYPKQSSSFRLNGNYRKISDMTRVNDRTIEVFRYLEEYKNIKVIRVSTTDDREGTIEIRSENQLLGKRFLNKKKGAELRLKNDGQVLRKLSVIIPAGFDMNKIKVQVFTKANANERMYTNQNVVLYVDAIDSMSGIKSFKFNDSRKSGVDMHISPAYRENTDVSITVTDVAENETKTKIKINNIDKTPPSCSLIASGRILGRNNSTHLKVPYSQLPWFQSNINIRFNSMSDAGTNLGSGAIRDYSFNYTEPNVALGSSKAKTHTANHKQGATSQYVGYIVDLAGNYSECDINVRKDDEAPKCSISLNGRMGNNGWYVSQVNLKMNSNDRYSRGSGIVGENGSGVETATISGRDGTRNGSTYVSISHNTDGRNFRYTGTVRDRAGNVGSCSSKTFKKDAEIPRCSVYLNGRRWSQYGVRVGVTASDRISGVYRSPRGSYTLYSSRTFNVEDYAGNVGRCGAYVYSRTAHLRTPYRTWADEYQYPAGTRCPDRNRCRNDNWGGWEEPEPEPEMYTVSISSVCGRPFLHHGNPDYGQGDLISTPSSITLPGDQYFSYSVRGELGDETWVLGPYRATPESVGSGGRNHTITKSGHRISIYYYGSC